MQILIASLSLLLTVYFAVFLYLLVEGHGTFWDALKDAAAWPLRLF